MHKNVDLSILRDALFSHLEFLLIQISLFYGEICTFI